MKLEWKNDATTDGRFFLNASQVRGEPTWRYLCESNDWANSVGRRLGFEKDTTYETEQIARDLDLDLSQCGAGAKARLRKMAQQIADEEERRNA